MTNMATTQQIREYRLISPLKAEFSSNDESCELSDAELVKYKDEISQKCEQSFEYENRGLADYIAGDTRYPLLVETVESIIISVTVIKGQLFGLAVVRTTEDLTEEGMEQLKSYLTGQYSDGWGEGFEQHAVCTEKREVEIEEEYEDEYGETCTQTITDTQDSELLVSFWSYDSEWAITVLDEEGKTEEEVKKVKPRAKLLGEDGNVFNLIGIAQKALKAVGQKAEAKEMADKIFASGSYGEALNIIQEYVEVY